MTLLLFPPRLAELYLESSGFPTAASEPSRGPLGERHSGPAEESGLRAGLEPVRCGCMRLEALSCGSALSDGAVMVRLQSPVSQSNTYPGVAVKVFCRYN